MEIICKRHALGWECTCKNEVVKEMTKRELKTSYKFIWIMEKGNDLDVVDDRNIAYFIARLAVRNGWNFEIVNH